MLHIIVKLLPKRLSMRIQPLRHILARGRRKRAAEYRNRNRMRF